MHFPCIAGNELACHVIHQRSKDVALGDESERIHHLQVRKQNNKGIRPGFETEGGRPKEVQNRDIDFS